MKENARDPYVGLNEYFGRKASEAVPSWYAVGKVLATSPLKIRADGLDLDLEDLFIAQHLTAGWQEQLTGLWRSLSVCCVCQTGLSWNEAKEREVNTIWQASENGVTAISSWSPWATTTRELASNPDRKPFIRPRG